jgi:hypothetical protein
MKFPADFFLVCFAENLSVPKTKTLEIANLQSAHAHADGIIKTEIRRKQRQNKDERSEKAAKYRT